MRSQRSWDSECRDQSRARSGRCLESPLLTQIAYGPKLRSVKWLVMLMLMLAACGGERPPASPGGIGKPPGPITGGGGNGGTGGVGGTGGTGGMGGAGGVSNGACDNRSDLDVIVGAGTSVRVVARDCGLTVLCADAVGSGPAYEVCVTNCVERDVDGLSSECADCYGALERCSYAGFCFESCRLEACGAVCNNCLETAGCLSEFEDCRGLPGDGCSDP
jgi:hypothetical protein